MLATGASMLDTPLDMSHIGTLNERTLHRELKELVAEPDDRFEVEMDGYVIDIVRGAQLIEIQTGSLGALGKKLDALLDSNDVNVVTPISVMSWHHKNDGTVRKSPVRRTIYNLFDELVSLPTLVDHPRFTLDVVLIEEDTRRIHDPTLRRRRGGWRTVDRSIRSVVERRSFPNAQSLVGLIPPGLPDTFTTADIARIAGIHRSLAQKMAYCFRALGAFEAGARTRHGINYTTSSASS